MVPQVAESAGELADTVASNGVSVEAARLPPGSRATRALCVEFIQEAHKLVKDFPARLQTECPEVRGNPAQTFMTPSGNGFTVGVVEGTKILS